MLKEASTSCYYYKEHIISIVVTHPQDEVDVRIRVLRRLCHDHDYVGGEHPAEDNKPNDCRGPLAKTAFVPTQLHRLYRETARVVQEANEIWNSPAHTARTACSGYDCNNEGPLISRGLHTHVHHPTICKHYYY